MDDRTIKSLENTWYYQYTLLAYRVNHIAHLFQLDYNRVFVITRKQFIHHHDHKPVPATIPVS